MQHEDRTDRTVRSTRRKRRDHAVVRKMNPPDDANDLLRTINMAKHAAKTLCEEDHQLIARMIEAIKGGSKGVFLVINPDNSIDYLIANDTRLGAISVLSRMIQRTANRIENFGE